jgi:pyruvyl transferase EpsO
MKSRTAKCLQLRQEIVAQLGGLVDRDYVLLGLPYYLNVGDILIWEGERRFLSELPHKCLNQGYQYSDSWRIRDDTLLLLQGGGNFGDLWRYIQDERLDISRRYKNNPIVITPVTVWYENPDLMQQDAEVFSAHPNLTICARDARSFELLQKHFTNRILLVPDMAFCIEPASLKRYAGHADRETLFLKRTDKELASPSASLPQKMADADVHDWPCMEQEPRYWMRYHRLCSQAAAVGRLKLRGGWRLYRALHGLSDWYYHTRCRELLIRDGVKFVSRYQNIYTTRLHVAILAVLLDKPVTILDNSYGKNSSFIETWMNDTEGVNLMKHY